MTLDDLAEQLHALEKIDGSAFRRRARVLQSIWRKEQGYRVGKHTSRGTARPLGSRLEMPWARETLANFLTPTIRDVVRSEALDRKKSAGKLYGKPRIFNDLLSSQPLAFNLFGELQRDLELCGRLVERMTGGRFRSVVRVEFEHSPARSDPRYTGDRTAFDVYLTCRTHKGARGFIGIEVKYHENLKGKREESTPRLDEIAAAAGCFDPSCAERLQRNPLQQIRRDHLLACSMLQVDDFADGLFVFLFPQDNDDCSEAVSAYRACLTNDRSFAAWTIEGIVGVLKELSTAVWIDAFHDRYLDFGKIDRRLSHQAETSAD